MSEYRLPPDVDIIPTTVPLAESVSWADAILDIEPAWKESQGEGVPIAILDTLVDESHPDLLDAIDDVADFANSGGHYHPHGTHVASLVGARAGNRIGIRGFAPKCRLHCYAVLGRSGGGTEQSIAAGFQRAYDKGCWVFSGSYGGSDAMPYLDALVRELRQDAKLLGRPFIPVKACGNDGGYTNFPARYLWSVAVGAFDANGDITGFTSRVGRLPVVLGPGVEMLGCLPGNRYGTMTGTSQATPVASAVVALALAKEQRDGSNTELLTTEDAIEHLIKGSVDKVTKGEHWRLLNARKTLEAIQPTPAPPLPPPGLTCGKRLFTYAWFGKPNWVTVDTEAAA